MNSSIAKLYAAITKPSQFDCHTLRSCGHNMAAISTMEKDVPIVVPITGECFCGDIQYQVNGKLRDAKSCHCSRCRKAFSGQASASALIEPDEFVWLSGESLLTSFVGQDGYGFQFCKNCGSTLCTILNEKVFQVTLGCVNGSPDIEIGQHIFVGSKASWEVIPEGVIQFQNGPE